MLINTAAFITALGIGLLGGGLVIPFLRRLKFGQSIREEGPESHQKKTGTPTMGGIIFFFTFVLTALIFNRQSAELWFLILFALLFGFAGLADDYLIIRRKSNQGLSVKGKFLLLALFSFFLVMVYQYILQYPTWIGIAARGWSWELGPVYGLFAVLLIVGTTNAVNITDGIDGLSSSVTMVVSLFFLYISHQQNQEGAFLFSLLLFASCLAFLYYNWNPARVFMGDTGSLLLGGAVAGLAMVTKTELLLPLVGGVYVGETFSVILQVMSYKIRKKRIFKMSPIHHHFELSGWKEKKIVLVFTMVAALCIILAIWAVQ